MIGETKVFIGQCIDICWLLDPAAATAVLEHAFDDGISSLSMEGDLLLVFFDRIS